LLVVAFREITRPRVTDENEVARQVDVAALETRQLRPCADQYRRPLPRAVARTACRVATTSCTSRKKGFRFGSRRRRTRSAGFAPRHSSTRMAAAKYAMHEPAHVVHVGGRVLLLLRQQRTRRAMLFEEVVASTNPRP